MNAIHLTSEQAIRLIGLPSKQLQLFLIMVVLSNEKGAISEYELFGATNAINLASSKVSGNLSALQKRRLIIEVGSRIWLINPEATSLIIDQPDNFRAIEKATALTELLKVKERYERSSK